ncbi:hypothetical protein Taro_054115, partial [Colocasia esculenta]|nr:hypothetical protein [Colocasia esculenta]
VYTALVIDGVDTGSLFLELFHEERVQCVDTVPRSGVDTVLGSVDTRPSFQKTLFGQLGLCVDTLRLKFQLNDFSGHVAVWGSREST